MASSLSALPALPFNPARLRSYLLRLPLFTRVVLLIIVALWAMELQTVWNVVKWGALIPDEMNIGTSMLPCEMQKKKKGNRLNVIDSVPTEYIPRDSLRLLPRSSQYIGFDAAA